MKLTMCGGGRSGCNEMHSLHGCKRPSSWWRLHPKIPFSRRGGLRTYGRKRLLGKIYLLSEYGSVWAIRVTSGTRGSQACTVWNNMMQASGARVVPLRSVPKNWSCADAECWTTSHSTSELLAISRA
jgi:hypothetical protein